MLKFYEIFSMVLGNIFLLILLGLLIYSIVYRVRTKNLAKTAAKKIHESNFLQETFKPMTDKEKKRLQEKGLSETKITYDLKNNKVETSDDKVKFEDTVMHYTNDEPDNSVIVLISDHGDETGDVLYSFIKDKNKEYLNETLFDKYKFNKVLNHKVEPRGNKTNILKLLVDEYNFFVPEEINKEA